MCACGGKALAEFMDLEFGISEEMVRVQRLTKVSIQVDGKCWTANVFGNYGWFDRLLSGYLVGKNMWLLGLDR